MIYAQGCASTMKNTPPSSEKCDKILSFERESLSNREISFCDRVL